MGGWMRKKYEGKERPNWPRSAVSEGSSVEHQCYKILPEERALVQIIL
jgi:hypothetical protein